MPIYCERCGEEIRKNIKDLSKREIVKCLEKAVMDGAIKDVKLFTYEAGLSSGLTTEEEDIIMSYHLGNHTDLRLRKSRRFLRPEK
jgi:hypothetical protein